MVKGSDQIRRMMDAEVSQRSKPHSGAAEAFEDFLARGGQVQVIAAPVAPYIGYPRPHWRRGKGTD